jgi:alcohol dehydrogenase (NADP+)
MSSIKAIKLNTGTLMPTLGLGTWKSAAGEVKAAVISAIESGYRAIDCAAGYGNEGEVGEALTDVISRGIVAREELFITSKLWVSSAYPEEVAGALSKTLSDLKLAYLDLYLIHWPFSLVKGSAFPAPVENRRGYSAEAYLAVWRELEKEVDGGRAKAIGCSNMSAKKLDELLAHARIPPAVNQVEGHPYLASTDLLAWCGSKGIAMTAYSPLGSPDRPARLVEEGDPAPLFSETIIAIAGAHNKSAAQVLIRWAIQRGTIVIPKSVTPARIASNIAVFDFELTEEDMKAIAALNNGQRLIKGYPWLTEGQVWQDCWDLTKTA